MFPKVNVQGSDYTYDGTVVAVFSKLSKKVRCVVEDANGRLFIHNAHNLGMTDIALTSAWAEELARRAQEMVDYHMDRL